MNLRWIHLYEITEGREIVSNIEEFERSLSKNIDRNIKEELVNYCKEIYTPLDIGVLENVLNNWDFLSMISVVIPSLGGDLRETLNSLNSGTVKPDEIIICLPNKDHSVKDLSKYKNTSVVYSEKYGQVYQRIFGFRKSK